jgi:hypothetical protein
MASPVIPDAAPDLIAEGPDAVLVAACATARAAVATYNAAAEQDEPGDLTALFDRERLAVECVAATRARTPRGLAEKAALLDECGDTIEALNLAFSLAADAVVVVRQMVRG